MSEHDAHDVTRLLAHWNDGPEAAAALLPLVYDELRRLARSYLSKERAGHTLQPTALVHEAYLRLAGKVQVPWQDRVHFYAAVAKVMRQILVDHARRRSTTKRGGDAIKISLAEAPEPLDPRAADILALDQALADLQRFDPRKAQIIELRFFAGLTIDETASLLEVSSPTVIKDTRKARAWLYAHLTAGSADGI